MEDVRDDECIDCGGKLETYEVCGVFLQPEMAVRCPHCQPIIEEEKPSEIKTNLGDVLRRSLLNGE